MELANKKCVPPQIDGVARPGVRLLSHSISVNNGSKSDQESVGCVSQGSYEEIQERGKKSI
ncbi:hypothetical protein F511_46527 [Dorcoceras hygrometricum]|uniref:Uncharacterized protein n=1 Tax=Dorcoceras hygrometricum TaxID=472368 RepID=A0A2Z7A081_9LAMI|nr:hypothetical protein F511_46527 [Dorcoceras hygrometricum]